MKIKLLYTVLNFSYVVVMHVKKEMIIATFITKFLFLYEKNFLCPTV